MIISPDSIESLKIAADNKTPVFFSADTVGIVFQTLIHRVDTDHLILENRVPPEHISKVVESNAFHIQVEMLRLHCDKIGSDGAHIIFPMDQLNEIEDHRGAKRFLFTDDDVKMEVVNPYDQSTLLVKDVMDISSTGISIKTPVCSRLYDPGTQFKNIRIMVNGETYSRTDGEVIYHRQFLDLKGRYYYQVGFKFENPVSS